MPADRDRPDVAFGAGAADHDVPDEELPERREREYRLLRRLRRPVGYLAVGAVLVLGIVKLSTLHGTGVAPASSSPVAGRTGRVSPPAVTPPSPTWVSADVVTASGAPGSFVLRSAVLDVPSPSETGVAVTVVPIPDNGELVSDGSDAVPCPGGDTCSTAYDLPDPVLRALRAAYPGAVVVKAKSVTIVGATDSTLLTRFVQATAGGRTVDIQVGSQGLGPDSSGHRAEGADRLVYAQSSASGYSINTTVVEPASRPPSDAAALRLAQDPALTVPS